MSDIKISQLNATTTLGSSDIFPVSKSLGGGQWESRSISSLNLIHSLSSSRSILVSKDGATDSNNIKDAVALAVSMSPTQINPVSIHILPGTYTENNPITIPQWVSICSQSGEYGVTVKPQNNGEVFITLGSNSLSGVTIQGDASLSNTTAYKSSIHTTSNIDACIIRDCDIGIWSNGGSIYATSIVGLSITKTMDKFMYCTSSGLLNSTNCGQVKIVNNTNYAFFSKDAGSELYVFSGSMSGATNGLYAENSGYIDGLSLHFEDCVNAMHIGATGSSQFKIMGSIVEGSSINDLFVESSTARVAYTGHIDSSKFSIINGASINIVADDDNVDGGLVTGKASLQGKVSIGTPGAITLGEDIQLNIGEGSAFVNDKQGNPIVEYWSYDASAPSGSKFTRFTNNAGTQLTGANDAIIVGCKYPFPALRLDINVPLVTANYITTEYWNGSTWIDLTAQLPGGGVAGYRRTDFALRANSIFRNVETQFVEVSQDIFDNGDWADADDVLDQIPNWDANDSFYAIRFRNNGVLTSGMVFSNGMVKPNSFMFSTSGKQANFGIYRTDRSLYIDSSSFSEDTTNPPSYTSIQMSSNISYKNIPVFLKSNNISQVSVAFVIPYDVDTSSPLRCYVDGLATTAATGDVLSTLYVARIDSNNPPSTLPLPETEFGPVITPTPGSANGFMTITQYIDMSSYGPEDILLIAFARLASDPSDTYTGDLIVGDMTLKYHAKFV